MKLLRALPLLVAVAAQGGGTGQAQTVTVRATTTLPAYRDHLVALRAIVAECGRLKDGGACGAGRVGPDDEVRLGAATRLISYAWLRQALEQAPKGGTGLKAADDRLIEDIAASASFAPGPAPVPVPRARLNTILAAREFVHVHQPSFFAQMWDRILRWLFRSLGTATGGSGQWLGRLFWLVLLALGLGGLVWWFSRQLRREGLAVREPAPARTATGAPLAWEAAWTEAQRLASTGAWREAIYATYWAATARLAAELRWPRDPARTPRETVLLLDPAGPRRGVFARLTRNFERTWYGYRVAGPEDFDGARELLLQLFPQMDRRA
jgi:hypothetical protein